MFYNSSYVDYNSSYSQKVNLHRHFHTLRNRIGTALLYDDAAVKLHVPNNSVQNLHLTMKKRQI